MRKARKKISQKDAAMWKRRAERAERLVDAYTPTPTPRFEICSFTLNGEMAAKLEGAKAFGAKCRVEQFGTTFRVYAFRWKATP